MSEPRYRKLTAMGVASLVSTGRPEVLDRLSSEICNLWLDVFAEIKEARELAAELGAIQQGEQSWGMGSGRPSRGRASKAKVTSFKEDSDEDEDHDDGEGAKDDQDASGGDRDEDSDEDVEIAKSRRSAKYKADLAFLGDDDSDDSE